MPKRRDLDERFTLAPLEGEEVLRHLLGDDETGQDDGPPEDEDS